MDRRTFLGGVSFGLLVLPRPALAQVATNAARIGWLSGTYGAQPNGPYLRAFSEGLRESGYTIGQNVLMDVRAPATPDKIEQYAKLARELVARRVEVILAANPHALEAVTSATSRIPIVGLDLETDPVGRGWVASVARPAGNLTGFFLDIPEMSGKQLQFLKEVKPSLTRAAVLGDPRVNELQFQATAAAARDAQVILQLLAVKGPNDIQGAIAEAAQRRVGALVVLTSPLVNASLKPIAEAAVQHWLPAICPFTAFAEAGGLLAYGPDLPDIFRRAAGYVALILKGTKTGDLPLQRPTKFELVINLKTAKALGVTIPPSLLARADQVIE